MKTDWEDDWENTIPDLLVSIENKRRQVKLLEERKLMEDAEVALAEELFHGDHESKKEIFVPVKIVKKKKTKSLQFLHEERKKELQEKQKQQSQKQKGKKLQKKKHEELFGDSELNEYDEMCVYIEDQY